MLPDLTVLTPETVEYLLLFSLEQEVPVLTFSDKYLEMGGLLSIGVDPYDMGRQAGELGRRILSAPKARQSDFVFARKGLVTINSTVARKLGIQVTGLPDTRTWSK